MSTGFLQLSVALGVALYARFENAVYTAVS